MGEHLHPGKNSVGQAGTAELALSRQAAWHRCRIAIHLVERTGRRSGGLVARLASLVYRSGSAEWREPVFVQSREVAREPHACECRGRALRGHGRALRGHDGRSHWAGLAAASILRSSLRRKRHHRAVRRNQIFRTKAACRMSAACRYRPTSSSLLSGSSSFFCRGSSCNGSLEVLGERRGGLLRDGNVRQ